MYIESVKTMKKGLNKKLFKGLVALPLVSLLFSGQVLAGDKDTNACAPKAYEMAIKYQQKSAEVIALRYQAYNIAKLRLDAYLAKYKGQRSKLAIITDLDETVLDNSPLLVRDMQLCHDFSTWDTWKDWERKGNPKIYAGAKAFFDHVNKEGVKIFYISDRYDETKAFTLKTLKNLGLPQVSEKSVLLYKEPKKVRRAQVFKNYNVIMQMGDTLHDFDNSFAENKKNVPVQRELAHKNKLHFGADWIVFPNSSYGKWKNEELDAWKSPLVIE